MKVKTLRSAPLAAALAVVFALSALIGAGSAAAAPKTVNGSVGPGFTISLKRAGAPVRRLKPGKYTIVVRDLAAIHNFHLTGPGINKKTSVVKTGRTTWTLKLAHGTYSYVCDPHRTFMKGSFRVT
jgi:plastocyanin